MLKAKVSNSSSEPSSHPHLAKARGRERRAGPVVALSRLKVVPARQGGGGRGGRFEVGEEVGGKREESRLGGSIGSRGERGAEGSAVRSCGRASDRREDGVLQSGR